MRLREILSEALRNVASGTSRSLLFALVLCACCAGTGLLLQGNVGGVARAAAAWQDSGAAVQILSQPGKISGERCRALAAVPGVQAAGAIRQGQRFRLAQLPDAPVQILEVSQGLAGVLRVQGGAAADISAGDAAKSGAQSPGAGVWLSSDLAADLAPGGAPRFITVLRGQTNSVGGFSSTAAEVSSTSAEPSSIRVPVGGVYTHREDGRAPLLAYAVAVPVPDNGMFDTCLAFIWPESQELTQLLRYTVTGEEARGEALPQVQQLNSALGTEFAASARLAVLPVWLVCVVAAGVAVACGFAFVFGRRLECAAALHAGVQKSALLLQLLFEYVLVAVPACVFSAALLLFAAFVGGELDVGVWLSGVGVCVLAAAAGLFGVLCSGLGLREAQLFRLFKQRN